MTLPNRRMTRRRLVAAVAAVGVAGFGAGAGTMARFGDPESSGGNDITAGTLDLTLDGSDATVTFLSAVGVAPGDSGSATLTVANAGSLTGYVDVEVASLTTFENGLSGNENSVDSTGGDPGRGNGELQNYLEVAAAFSSGPELWSGYDLVSSRLTAGTVYDLDYRLSGGSSDTFAFDWRLPSDAGDDAQSDSVAFTLTFRLDQRTDSGL